MLRVIIINGPNLNLLGRREPEIYGEDSFEDFMIYLKGKFVDSDVELTYFQSNRRLYPHQYRPRGCYLRHRDAGH
jgi:3-dehydroquinate dehydratase-2